VATQWRNMSKLDTIKLFKDSEYIRLFGDDDVTEEFMENVYKKELGSNFIKVESGVVVGSSEEERPAPMPPKSPYK
jgi:hypothetical protein